MQSREMPAEGRLLVALSGGADSVALLCVLLDLGYDCVAVHCNFHLRGDESNRDECFVHDLCRKRDVLCFVKHFDVPAYMQAHHVSVEMACRELRYRWFEEMRREQRCAAIAVAHHLDDNVETFFLNLFRGTGVAGLSGMRPRNGRIIRPLLCVGRHDIEQYLCEKGEDYVVDSTNSESDYARNKIRNKIMPVVRECFPAAEQGIKATMDNLSGCKAVFHQAIDAYRRRMVSRAGQCVRIDCALLADAADGKSTVLHELLMPYGFNSTQSALIGRAVATGRTGAVFEALGYVAEIGRGVILIHARSECARDESEWRFSLDRISDLPVNLSVSVVERDENFSFLRDGSIAYFDESILTETLTLRHWREGDRFRPFGMRGSKKLSDYFTDHKFSLSEKRRAWVLCAGQKIIWLVGHRQGAEFSVSSSSKRVVVVKVV